MGLKITKAEHDALPDSLKTKFTPDGDGFSMEEEDVSGLKAKRDELLADLKRTKEDAASKAERLAALESERSKIEDEKLTKKGEWEQLRERMEAKHAEELASLKKEIETRDQTAAERDLQLKLINGGVREDRAEDLAIVLKSKHIKPVTENGNVLWRSLDDTQTINLETYIPGLKESKADYFKANGASGSGASGSQGSGGAGTQTGTQPGYGTLLNAYAEGSKT